MSNFPANPADKTIFELEPGLLYKYDAFLNSWIEIVSSDVILPAATTIKPGAMTAADLKKLNRLVLPPPRSTIQGTDCVAPFRSGALTLSSGDKYVGIGGNIDVRNIDSVGDVISQQYPFQIHQHTFGYDFTLDLPALVDTLLKRGQLDVYGPQGKVGPVGDTGDHGEDEIFSGPAGDKGDQGAAPDCELTLEPEPLQAQVRSGLKKVLSAVRVVVDPNDDMLYSLQFDRQSLGIEDLAASKFNVRQQKSTWVLAVTSIAGTSQPVYYLDVEPIINTIRDKYAVELNRLKKGYEDIVKFWVQTMSDLFDEQKAALCCALEFCLSKTKSINARQHMETVAATVVGKAKMNLQNRQSIESVELSSSRLLNDLPDGVDTCKNGPSFPQGSNRVENNANNPPITTASVQSLGFVENKLVLDPLMNAGVSNGVILELDAGSYTVVLEKVVAQINGMHYAPIAVQYVNNNRTKIVKFLDKGRFPSLLDGRAAYEGLSTSFTHDGGVVRFYYNMMPTPSTSGEIVISVALSSGESASVQLEPITQPQKAVEKQVVTSDPISCRMTINKLSWYQRGWETNNCCGCVVNVGGQDYIIVKRSLGEERNCGGGESLSTPCIAKFIDDYGHPSIAWPTLDGRTFAPLPDTDSVLFKYDQTINDLVSNKISSGEIMLNKGNPSGTRHLSYQLMTVIFPVF